MKPDAISKYRYHTYAEIHLPVCRVKSSYINLCALVLRHKSFAPIALLEALKDWYKAKGSLSPESIKIVRGDLDTFYSIWKSSFKCNDYINCDGRAHDVAFIIHKKILSQIQSKAALPEFNSDKWISHDHVKCFWSNHWQRKLYFRLNPNTLQRLK
jgi:hypothetical protein